MRGSADGDQERSVPENTASKAGHRRSRNGATDSITANDGTMTVDETLTVIRNVEEA